MRITSSDLSVDLGALGRYRAQVRGIDGLLLMHTGHPKWGEGMQVCPALVLH